MLVANGLEGMADAMATMLNEAMKIERSAALRAEPGEHCAERRGYANGFKPKRLSSRAELLNLRIPQVRALPGTEPLEFDPNRLERGIRSERALKIAIAEMYLKRVSTRKVVAITRTAVATLFPNEESLLRLVTAMVAEVSDEWEIGRA